ncbi:MAG TPA: hypothetical protein VJ772_01905 [Nitrososphaeraceae archaeon]|nr:hypothetical protein [Nitrososphaeraceae archaeon]
MESRYKLTILKFVAVTSVVMMFTYPLNSLYAEKPKFDLTSSTGVYCNKLWDQIEQHRKNGEKQQADEKASHYAEVCAPIYGGSPRLSQEANVLDGGSQSLAQLPSQGADDNDVRNQEILANRGLFLKNNETANMQMFFKDNEEMKLNTSNALTGNRMPLTADVGGVVNPDTTGDPVPYSCGTNPRTGVKECNSVGVADSLKLYAERDTACKDALLCKEPSKDGPGGCTCTAK